METFLLPIEKPNGFGMKLAYFFTKKKFGKILTPLKVHSARLPIAFGMFYNKVSELDEKLALSKEMTFLIRQKVAQINICDFCMDASRYKFIQTSMNIQKLEELANHKNSEVFSEAEKIALDYTVELTKNKNIKPNTFRELSKHFTEREICEIVYIIASEHIYNLTNIGLNIHSDMLCDIKKNKK